jgi:hypothetical protein
MSERSRKLLLLQQQQHIVSISSLEKTPRVMTTMGKSTSITRIFGCLIAIFATTAPLLCNSFVVTSTRSLSSRIPDNNLSQLHGSTISRWIRPRSTTTTNYSFSTRLHVAKTGGKMIDTEEQFAEVVLAQDIPRPVMVFFSAPW